jgi:hypothetical protein
LCFSIGNEIPAPIVRWHGRRKIEKFLKRLYKIAKKEGPHALITYVNYPTTEYLQLPFLDICASMCSWNQRMLSSATWRVCSPGRGQATVDGRIRSRQPAQRELAQAEKLKWQIQKRPLKPVVAAPSFCWTDEVVSWRL